MTIRKIVAGRVALFCVLAGLCVVGCSAREPQMVNGLTGIVYNYTTDSYATVRIGGKTVGTTLQRAKAGDVTGGGGMCCFNLPLGATEVEVVLESSGGDYKTTAQIEQWWPDLAHYGVVHILPGRKIVMQVTPSAPRPRKDLLEKRQEELGLKKEILFDYWSAGPIERIDGKGK